MATMMRTRRTTTITHTRTAATTNHSTRSSNNRKMQSKRSSDETKKKKKKKKGKMGNYSTCFNFVKVLVTLFFLMKFPSCHMVQRPLSASPGLQCAILLLLPEAVSFSRRKNWRNRPNAPQTNLVSFRIIRSKIQTKTKAQQYSSTVLRTISPCQSQCSSAQAWVQVKDKYIDTVLMKYWWSIDILLMKYWWGEVLIKYCWSTDKVLMK